MRENSHYEHHQAVCMQARCGLGSGQCKKPPGGTGGELNSLLGMRQP